jgi:hypothetical protein
VKTVTAVAGLTAGALISASLMAAGPAYAANGTCQDYTLNSPTPLHQYPTDTSTTVKQLPEGYAVTGSCRYYQHNDPDGQHWFMQVNYIGPGNNGGYGYIWVQKLFNGEYHDCYDNGNLLSISPSSPYCPLINY